MQPANGEEPDRRDVTDIFSGGKAGYLLSQHLRTVLDYSPGEARRESLSLSNLKQQDERLKQQMAAELLTAYSRLEEGNYSLRWLVIDLLAQLEINEAADALAEVTLSTIPSEKMAEDHHNSTTDEELSIRLASTRGLAKLAADGDQMAAEKLLVIAEESPLRAIQIQAVHGFLLAPLKKIGSTSIEAYKLSEIYQARLQELEKRLPAETVRLADIKPASADNMIVPEEVLKATEQPDKTKSKSRFSGTQAPRVPETVDRDNDR